MLDLFDVERIEVLKGPQGVLFGKNNLAGTINVITARPTEDFGGEVRLTAGSFGLRQVRGKINKIGRESCRERVCQYVTISVVDVSLKKNTQNYMRIYAL